MTRQTDLNQDKYTSQTLTNGDLRRLTPLGEETRSRHRWWLLLLALIVAAAATAYRWHPYLQTLPPTPRLLASALGLVLWPSWPLAALAHEQMLVGALPLTAAAFSRWYLGLAALLPAVPWLLYRWWLWLPAGPRQVNRYRAEEHRRQQGQLTGGEARRLLAMGQAGLPLASLEREQTKRHQDLIGLPAGALEGHVLVVGATRSGKGMHLTETLLRYPGAMVVIDPKGEQYERTAGYRAQRGPVYRLPAHTLDLARYYDLGDRDDVAELHFHLLRPWADRQPVFADKSKALFSAAGAFAAAHGLNPIRVLLDAADSDPAVALAALATVAPDAVAAFSNGRPPDSLDRMSSSAWGTFATRMYEYQAHVHTITASGATNRATSRATTCATSVPRDWAARNATIYLTYPFHQLKGVGGVVSAIVAALMRYQIRSDARTPAVIAVDELPAVGLRNVTEYLATAGGYGLTLLLYVQTYAQLVGLYGPRGAETVLANCQHQVWYPPADAVTAGQMETLYGTTLKPALSLSRSVSKERFELDAGQRRESVSEGLQQVPYRAAAQLMALDPEQVVVRAGRRYVLTAHRLWPAPRLADLPPLAYTVTAGPPPPRQKTDWGAYLPAGQATGAATAPEATAPDPQDPDRAYNG